MIILKTLSLEVLIIVLSQGIFEISIAAMTIKTGIVGNEIKASVTRIRTVSTAPP
ncbi:hypothetical protein D3C87_1381080 [compost metagenome]